MQVLGGMGEEWRCSCSVDLTGKGILSSGQTMGFCTLQTTPGKRFPHYASLDPFYDVVWRNQ